MRPSTQRGGPPRQGPPRETSPSTGQAPTSLPPARDQYATERAWRQRRRWHAARLAHQLMPLDHYYATSVPPLDRLVAASAPGPDRAGELAALKQRVARLEAEVRDLRRRLEGQGGRR